MEVKLIEKGNSSLWNEYVLNHKDSIAWHCFEWSRIVKKHYGLEFIPLAAEEKGEIQGILPLYRMANDSLISVPYAVAGGMLWDNENAQEALFSKARSMIVETSGQTITFKQYKVPLNLLLKEDRNYYNRELDLTKGTDTVYRGFDGENRDEIEKTEAESLDFQYPSDDLDDYYELLLKHNRRKGLPCVSREWVGDLIGSHWYSLAVLKSENRIKAATLVKEYKKTVSFPLSCKPVGKGDSDKYVYRLYWELIKNLIEREFEIFHSGRIHDDGKTDRYRLGWGGEKHLYYYQYFPGSYEETESVVKKNWKIDTFKAIWRNLPLPIVRTMGPRINKRFP